MTAGPTKTQLPALQGLEEGCDTPVYQEALTPSEISPSLEEEEVEDKCFSWGKFWCYVGPGWLLSVSYVDPGNLVSDLQAGAYAGYSLLWVMFAATCIGLLLQVLSARLGIVTGRHLAEVATSEYPRWASLVLWVMAEIAIVGCDVQTVLGSAIAFQLLFGLPLWIGCLVTVSDTITFLVLQRWGMKKLQAVFVALLLTMIVCFFMNTARGGVDAGALFSGFRPQVPSYAVTQAVGVVGAIVMPHNFYLHSALVLDAPIKRRTPSKLREANKYFSIEAAIALFISFLINAAVLVAFAHGFFSKECTSSFEATGTSTGCLIPGIVDEESYGTCVLHTGGIGECHQVGLSQAGDALHGVLGDLAKVVWAIGLLAAGQSTTMTGTFAGQFVMEGFLNFKLSSWQRVLVTRAVALIPSLTIAFINISNPGASDGMDEWLNVLQSVQAPFALLPVLYFTSSKKIMGEFANGKVLTTVGWFMTFIVFTANIYCVTQNFESISMSTTGTVVLFTVVIVYFWFLGYLAWHDIVRFFRWVGSKVCRCKSRAEN